ncbi:MAG: phosphoribosylformylglycinamidine synthase subunit PurQ, partial [Longicatena sp.]
MEVGAVVGAAPKDNVVRKTPAAGDIVVLIGGATGRDGVGGATGSSKEHNDTSLTKCSSEVQKGNAPIERKLQRLFRNPVATRLIKKANDFGAGGVSVAVGEIADGLIIDLDKVPVKYNGLSGTELAISESQERMAVLIESDKFDEFKQLAYEENLDACIVAVVTEEKRLVINFHGEEIVNISRAYLDTNGVRGLQDVLVTEGLTTMDPFHSSVNNIKENLKQPNVASQIGLAEMFDSSIGKSTVMMPFGGKYQLSETEGSVQKLPVFGFTNTCSIMTHGYHPEVSLYSPYLGAAYSVVEALARVVAMGGNYATCRLTNQEYFERLNDHPEKWGKPMQALLGLIEAEMAFETPAIGGKDSMSGTFNDITVPPTLITFAVTTEKTANIISPEFKKDGSYIYLVKHTPNKNMTPNYDMLKKNFTTVRNLILNNKVMSASTVKFGGISEALCKMSFGNKIGVDVTTKENVFDLSLGSIIVEADLPLDEENFILLGTTTNNDCIKINEETISIEEAISVWCERYDALYPMHVNAKEQTIETPVYKATEVKKARKTYEHPKVIIPVFPGQNCEYDTKQQFERAGAEVEVYVFNNLNVESIERSLKELSEKIAAAQILMIVGGFSSGDEPDGSGKFIANVLSNPSVNEAVQTLLANDGLIL